MMIQNSNVFNDSNLGETCPKTVKIGEIDKHEALCKLPKCSNYEICGNGLGATKEFQDLKVYYQ